MAKEEMLKRTGCDQCGCLWQEGECDPTYCFPCKDRKPAEGICLLAYAQALDEFDPLLEELPPGVKQCRKQARAANAPVRAKTAEWDKNDARRTVAKLRASLPLDAGSWQELIDASVLLDYDLAQRRGPHS